MLVFIVYSNTATYFELTGLLNVDIIRTTVKKKMIKKKKKSQFMNYYFFVFEQDC